MLDALIIGSIILIVIGWIANTITKRAQQVQGIFRGGHDPSRCRYCGSRIGSNPAGFGYAGHCRRCGRDQAAA